MSSYIAGDYDVIVIGAGHAGCEASLAAARMGMNTLLFTMNLDSIAMMPCNPSIGGTGKGHLVKEIDALGGEMGLNIDKSVIQSKMLNTAKGPAVHSLRAQADKQQYHVEMKRTIENQTNLHLRQGEVSELISEKGQIVGLRTATGSRFSAKAIILATGTYLRGKIFIGSFSKTSGPNGLAPSMHLTDSLESLGISLRRFKTGTPARINARSLDYDCLIEQPGDMKIHPFSFMNSSINRTQISCWLTYTNNKTHTIIRENIHRSAMYSGSIVGTGPRYCPSIEDKVNRFADKERHQLFLEPEGLMTNEVYVQGMSTSLPEDVQEQFMRSIAGLESVEIVRPAYVIEYDCVDPTQLKPTLEFKSISGLFSAGQFNGTSGYEEAGAQGVVAGINAARFVRGESGFVIKRSDGYIGVLIDDLVTKGTNEPYRIMTSRCEYRLLLRQDNADLRLTPLGYDAGLVSMERLNILNMKLEDIRVEKERISRTKIRFDVINPILTALGASAVRESQTIHELLKRPELNYSILSVVDSSRPELSEGLMNLIETEIKYEGYIRKQIYEVEKFKSIEKHEIPRDIDYSLIDNLRIEARQKLLSMKPDNVGQASRISGVSPADISVLLVYLEYHKRKKNNVE